MNRSIFLVTVLFFTSIAIYADPLAEADPWISDMISIKTAIQDDLARNHLPLMSAWKKHKEEPEVISVDLTGSDRLVLLTLKGPDGSGNDWAVWGNAYITKRDGSKIYLDQMDYLYGNANRNKLIYNKSISGTGLSIGSKKFVHGVLCHADGILIYDLPEDISGFHAEVGIDNASRAGSAYFKVINVYTKGVSEELVKKYDKAILPLLHVFGGNFDNWLETGGNAVEKQIADRLIGNLKDGKYFLKRISDIDRLKDEKQKTIEYFVLINKLNEIIDLQEKLPWINIPAIRAAFQDMSAMEDYDRERYEVMLRELSRLVDQGFDGIYRDEEDAFVCAEKALEYKRQILLGNPLLDEDRIVAARYHVKDRARTVMSPDLGTQNNNWSEQGSAARSGFDADIVELSDLRSNRLKIRSIYKPSNTSSIADLRLHWDGDRVLFSQTCEDLRWNVHEVHLDGSGFRKVIENEEPDLDFYDAAYLPDGRILAVSNIGYQGVPCVSGNDAVGNFVLYTPENRNLRRLTFDQDANWNPMIMSNGRVMYTRWEYTDLTHYYSRIVMHMNPDGTENKALYGSGSMFPNSTFDVQQLPGHSSAFVGIISGHHGVARSGRLVLFDPAKGRKNVHGVVQEIPYHDRPVVELIKDHLVDDVWPQFIKPMPLNDRYFLVTAKISEQGLWGIYLVDVFDNVTCIKESEGEGFISPILVKKRPLPPIIPDRVKLGDKEATFFIQDIYEGEGLRGIPRGTVKSLRLHAYEYAYVKTASDHNWHGIQSGWDIKRNLGTVPVEEDGSVMFKAPANTPISIQPLDEEGVAVQWMRSWVVGQPGEIVSCVGCHENQNQIPIPKRVLASQKPPVPLTPPEGGVRPFTFDLEIQPILDRACIACHNGEGPAFDLRGGKKDRYGYGTSYLNFHPYIRRQGGEGDMVVLQPYEYHPNTSELVRMLKKGHHGVELTDKEWRTLYNWIDYNAPDKGYFNANVLKMVPYKGFDQILRRKELTDKYANGAGVDWKKELADYAEKLEKQGEILPVKPQINGIQSKFKKVKMSNWPIDAINIEKMRQHAGCCKKEIEIAPGVSVAFVRIPAGEFIMGSNTGEPDARPVSKVKIQKAFWMAELETTNEQFNTVFPEHDSRFVDQQWKDHVRQGYPANNPDQPVIRVSFNDAMEFCREVSEKTGLHITLPTEAQWEWACRAGSDDDFWFGGMNSDFGRKENMADKTTLQFAVWGVDPQPMHPNASLYKHYTYLPKEVSVDDSSLVQIGGRFYEANPFGLYNMHGNVAEWTRSDYQPYPYSEKSQEISRYKVVRGGSYFERPKYSTSHTRKYYYPYQRVFNVGFRMIIED